MLSRQALDAQAEDLALEDALYSLNKALQDGIISAEVYMKQVDLQYPFAHVLHLACVVPTPEN